MTEKELFSILKETGLPVTHYQWHINQVPELPYIVFLIPNTDSEKADDGTWCEVAQIQVELYTKKDRDFSLERKVKAILDEHELSYDTEAQYLDTEEMFETIFYIEEVM